MFAVDKMYCQMVAASLIQREPNIILVKRAAAMAAAQFMSTAFPVASNLRRWVVVSNILELPIFIYLSGISERSTAGCPRQSCGQSEPPAHFSVGSF